MDTPAIVIEHDQIKTFHNVIDATAWQQLYGGEIIKEQGKPIWRVFPFKINTFITVTSVESD